MAITFGNETNFSSHINLTKTEQKWFFTKPFNGESDTEKVLLQLNSLISANVVKFEKEEGFKIANLQIGKQNLKSQDLIRLKL